MDFAFLEKVEQIKNDTAKATYTFCQSDLPDFISPLEVSIGRVSQDAEYTKNSTIRLTLVEKLR